MVTRFRAPFGDPLLTQSTKLLVLEKTLIVGIDDLSAFYVHTIRRMAMVVMGMVAMVAMGAGFRGRTGGRFTPAIEAVRTKRPGCSFALFRLIPSCA
jgi:hypothetical protein